MTVTTTQALPKATSALATGNTNLLVVVYVALMPLLVGLPRGTMLPVLRPSEGLQLAVTGLGLAIAAKALLDGSRWRLRLRATDGWLLAMMVCGSLLPLLLLGARGQSLGPDQILAAFPFVKYAALFFLVRVCVNDQKQALLVIHATIGSAMVIATLAITQALGVGPVLDTLGRFFVSGGEDIVDGGRATTTIGSAIATGAYLAISCGLALSQAFRTGGKHWIWISAWLAIGALASGQAGTVLALGVMVVVIAYLHRRLGTVLLWSLPAAALGVIGLWPIVAARLADLDQGSGLPKSWLIRWNNLSELYLPSLWDGGWLFGVNPDARVTPPDVWREVVYLESGYLWLLWVGGVPLVAAVIGFLLSAWRDLSPTFGSDGASDSTETATETSRDAVGDSIRIAGRAAVVMIALLSVIDPHLTLRAGADLFFVLIALGLGRRLAEPTTAAAHRWRSLMSSATTSNLAAARLRIAEAGDGNERLPNAFRTEARLLLEANLDGRIIGSTHLVLARRGTELHGFVDRSAIERANNASTKDRFEAQQAEALIWRALALSAGSLRMHSLHVTTDPATGDSSLNQDDAFVADRQELRSASSLANRLETMRTASSASRSSSSRSIVVDRSGELPGVRFETGWGIPRWKRASDLILGSAIMALSLPAWAICFLAVRRSSPGPVLYRQLRIGAGGLPFQIYKFRTMYVGNDDSIQRSINEQELAGEIDAWKDPNDSRVTPAGQWLRKLSLDELPQLINVWRGEMSLVGPRPSLLWEVALFEPTQRRRLQARPGLTGLWQVSGRADVSMLEMLNLDLDYVDRMGPGLDVRCLIGTASSVLHGEGAR